LLCHALRFRAHQKKRSKPLRRKPLNYKTNHVKTKILSRLSPARIRQLRFGALALALSGAAFATLGVVGPDAVPTTAATRALSLTSAAVVSIDDEDRGVFREERIQRGDTLASLLERLGVNDQAAFQYLRSSKDARPFSGNLRPGRTIRAETGSDGELVSLSYALSPTEILKVSKDDAGFSATKGELALERRVHMKAAEIRYSLFGSADAIGLPDSVTTQVAEIFSGDIDFHKDIRRGDRFRVVYEMMYHDGEFVRAGRVLAVEFVNNGKTFAAVWYENPENKESAGYFTPEGKNLRKAFLRSPLEFSRITSGFGGRLHPIFQTWKQHKGVDYAAPTGTRIRAIADGVVDFAGKQGGYGNVVIVRHQGQYSTLYAHMSGFGPNMSKGTRVGQGDTVGFVGQTGWATGPHLHYEFRVAAEAVNPLTIALPAAIPLEDRHLADFRLKALPSMTRIAMMRNVAQFATLD
jgi:murein DD-endopeptidase MepM/ murein hydrolase activator NlpD